MRFAVAAKELQENQKRLSRDIVEFMSRFQRGAKTLECSECGESVTMATIVGHFKAHINGLSRKIEVLMMAKRDNKRKHERGRDESQKKKMREASHSSHALSLAWLTRGGRVRGKSMRETRVSGR